MLESLANPEHRMLSVGQRCELLGISRSWWYEKMDNPIFKARASAHYRRLCDNRLGEVLAALVDSAMLPGKDGHPDRRLYLELLGEYRPGMDVNDERTRKPGERMTDEELIQAFEGREHLLPPGVKRRLQLEAAAGTEAK